MRYAIAHGIKVKPYPHFTNCGARGIDVDVKAATVYIPVLDLENALKINFLSLAVENHNFKGSCWVRSLLTVYDRLIENGEDVAHMRAKGMLKHDFNSDQECADFVNCALYYMQHEYPNYFIGKLDKLLENADAPGRKARVYLKEFLNNCWVSLYLFGAWAIPTFLALLSTIFVVISYYKL